MILGVIAIVEKEKRKKKEKHEKRRENRNLKVERYRDSSWKHQRCVTWSAKKIVGLTCPVSLRDAKWLMGSWTLWRELMGSLKSSFFSIYPLLFSTVTIHLGIILHFILFIFRPHTCRASDTFWWAHKITLEKYKYNISVIKMAVSTIRYGRTFIIQRGITIFNSTVDAVNRAQSDSTLKTIRRMTLSSIPQTAGLKIYTIPRSCSSRWYATDYRFVSAEVIRYRVFVDPDRFNA